MEETSLHLPRLTNGHIHILSHWSISYTKEIDIALHCVFTINPKGVETLLQKWSASVVMCHQVDMAAVSCGESIKSAHGNLNVKPSSSL